MQEADKQLLTRFFLNKCTREEFPKVKSLLQSAEGVTFFKQLAEKEWGDPLLQNEQDLALQESWKEKVKARILAEQNPASPSGRLKQLYRFRHAAIWLGILLIASAVLWQFLRSKEPITVAMVEKINESGIPVRHLLPDNSELFLAAGSKVRFAASFTGAIREVILEGEAFFDVKPNPHQPFIIHTGDVSTKVLGTSFKVTSVKNSPIEVAVATGKVNVQSQGKSLATLTPGLKVTWYPAEQKAVTGKTDANKLLNWRDGQLMFDSNTIEQIADELQKRFNVQIEIIDSRVKHNTVSGSFSANKSMDQILKALAVAGKFRYESKDNKSYKIFQIK